MIYYKNNVTPKRIEWWKSLSLREQNLRICLFEIRKIAISEQKTLLKYKKSRKEVLSAKATLKQLKLIAKAIERQIPGYINIERADDYSTAYRCAHCRQTIPYYASYCPNCGQRVSDNLV